MATVMTLPVEPISQTSPAPARRGRSLRCRPCTVCRDDGAIAQDHGADRRHLAASHGRLDDCVELAGRGRASGTGEGECGDDANAVETA